MKGTLILILALMLGSCATPQPSGPYPPASATDQFDKPPFVGMSKAQIARLIWRTE